MNARRRISLFLMLLYIAGIASTAQGATLLRGAASPATPEAVHTTPTQVVAETFAEWTIGGGMAYWKEACRGGEFPSNGFLRRKPSSGGTSTTMLTLASAAGTCDAVYKMAANEAGLYYFNFDQNRIELRQKSAPMGPVVPIYSPSIFPLIPVSQPKLDASHIYWVAANTLQRAALDGSGGLAMVATGANVKDLAVSPTHIYWLDDTGLWAVEKTCATAAICASTKIKLQTTTGRYLLHIPYLSLVDQKTYIYWVETTTAPERIRRMACSAPTTCSTPTTVYTAPSDHPWKIGQILRVAAGFTSNFYWTENYTDGTGSGGTVRRMTGNSTPVILADQLQGLSEHLFVDSLNLYFANLSGPGLIGMLRLPLDATAEVHDLAFGAWEVTQGIQSTANDVPLVAGRPTYVRVFGTQLTGTMAGSVKAELTGTRNGSPLPGSPLKSLSPSEWLVTGSTQLNERDIAGAGWMFKLPASWTDAGSITLKAVIDPQQSYSDPNLANNSKTQTFSFTKKAPACTIFVPVRTAGSANSWVYSSIFYPNSEAMLDLFERQWPVSDVWTYWHSTPVEEWEFLSMGPYELPDDGWKVLLSINARNLFADDPDECDAADATVHYVGVVTANTNTTVNGITSLGLGYLGVNSAWVKFPTYGDNPRPANTPVWAWPREGNTMVHEVSHNLDRKHINCTTPGNPISNTDPNYPYAPCQLSNSGFNSHFGFDVNSQTPISPTLAADYMTYSTPSWVSDYTWKALLNEINTIGLQKTAALPASINAPTALGGSAPAGTPDLAASAANVILTGVLTPSLNQGQLNYAWVYPTAAMSQGMREKWQGLASPAAGLPDNQAQGADSMSAYVPLYHVRLLDSTNTVLADQSFIPTFSEDDAVDAVPTASFALTFPAPAGTVSKVQLMIDNQVVAAMNPGPSAPAVTITSPAGGATLTDSMTISWQASDADAGDKLRYTVQYSSDLGQTWMAVATDINGSGNTTTLQLNNLEALAGSSTGSLIRVLASDGYHTTVATSQAFNLPNHAPAPFIISPTPVSRAAAGEVVIVRGGARDTEDGAVADAKLSWTLNGTPVGTGNEQTLAGLAPGTYDLALTARDSLNQSATVHTSLTIARLAIPSGDTPTLDGFCDDASYTAGQLLALAPYSDGTQALVHIVRDGTHLWACFANLKRGSSLSSAGLHVDVNNSRDSLAQVGDYRFFVSEDGTPAVGVGNGSGAFTAQPAQSLSTATSASATSWSAELRIDAGALGGWGHLVGLNAEQSAVSGSSDRYSWPYAAGAAQPNTWATTVLGGHSIYLPLLTK